MTRTHPPSRGSVNLLCPACGSEIVARDLHPGCGCGARLELHDGGGFPKSAITSCAACGSEAQYVAKDFNKHLGVAIVLFGCIGFYWGPVVGIACLVALTILDRIVYHLRPLVTVCYACKAIYRHLPVNPAHKPYQLSYDETFEGTGDDVAVSK